MSEEGSDYAVGYRRTPSATRFKPGQSGNQRGRPKESKNSRTILREEIEAKVEISENGKPRRISKQRIALRQLANKAASGDLKAIAQLHVMLRELEVGAECGSSVGPGVFDRPADTQTMTSIVERVTLSIRQKIAIEAAEPASTATAHDAQSASSRGDPPPLEPNKDVQSLDPKPRPEGGAS